MRWLRFAFQNTLRNRRRSLIAVMVAGVGTAAILMASGFALYTYESLGQAAARASGHLVVGDPRQFLDEETTPMEFGMTEAEAVGKKLLQDNAVRAVLPRVSFGGLLSNGDRSIVMLGEGVDPRSEFSVKGPFLKVLTGEVLSPDSVQDQVMVGEGLARSLKAKPGTSLTILATTTEGAMNAVDVVVSGTFSTGVPEVDKRIAYVDIRTAQKLMGTKKVTSMGVFLTRMDHTDDAQARLAKMLPDMKVRTWREEAFFYTSVKDLYNRIFGALGLIISVIVVFVVGNAMSMSIVERTRELSTLRAMGTLPRQLVWVMALEGMILGTAGAALGELLAVCASMLLYVFPVQMPPPPGRSTGYPLNIAIDLSIYFWVHVAMVALAMVVSALIARRTLSVSIPVGLAHT